MANSREPTTVIYYICTEARKIHFLRWCEALHCVAQWLMSAYTCWTYIGVCMPCALITMSEQIMNWSDDCDLNDPSIKHQCMKRVMARGLYMWLWDVCLIVVLLYLHTYVQLCEFQMGLPEVYTWTDNVWMVLIGYSKWHLHQQLLSAENRQKSQLVCSSRTSLYYSSIGCCIKCIWWTYRFRFYFKKGSAITIIEYIYS